MRKITIKTLQKKSKIGLKRFLWKVRKNKKRQRQSLNKSLWRTSFIPNLSDNINWISKHQNAFAFSINNPNDYSPILRIKVPKKFSIIDAEAQSFIFIRQLFDILYYQKCSRLFIDYADCEEIELGASVCMDIILKDFIRYTNQCRARKLPIRLRRITTENHKKRESVGKFLFSIGAHSTIKKIESHYDDIITYPLCTGNRSKPDSDGTMEVHTTELVEHLKKCLKRMDRELTPDEDKFFLLVIGEVMTNAEEHSTTRHRYSIGYFQDSENTDEHVGIFNLVILNFGATIYEKFKNPECQSLEVVRQMKDLSKRYTRKGFMRDADFNEETLWTLYALQEGVTSTGDQRGSGTIRFTEAFFNLKGDKNVDNISQLMIVSGQSRIIFDGTYGIVEKEKGSQRSKYKMLTFNESGNIEDKPNKKYVKFVQNYFPGTLISAKICIKQSTSNGSD